MLREGRGNPNKCPRFTNHDEACRVVDVANLGHEDHTCKSKERRVFISVEYNDTVKVSRT